MLDVHSTTPVTLSTDAVAARRRAAYWRDLICDVFVELDCGEVPRDRFFGRIDNSYLADIQFSLVRSEAQRVDRTASRIAASNQRYFLLSLQASGTGRVSQDGRSALLQTGDFAIYDTTRPYTLEFHDPFSQIVLTIPEQLVRDRLLAPERLTAIGIDGRRGTGRVVSNFIRQVHGQLHRLEPRSLNAMQHNVVDLFTTALGEQCAAPAENQTHGRAMLKQRVIQYVEDNLRHSDMTCATIAAAHRISVRYLSKLFEDEEHSLSEWIWRRRLEGARRDLADAGRGRRPITAIAFDWGFKDSAHFSRAFKARYGSAPKDYRAARA